METILAYTIVGIIGSTLCTLLASFVYKERLKGKLIIVFLIIFTPMELLVILEYINSSQEIGHMAESILEAIIIGMLMGVIIALMYAIIYKDNDKKNLGIAYLMGTVAFTIVSLWGMTLTDSVYFESEQTTYTIQYNKALTDMSYTDHVYIDFEENDIVKAENNGVITKPEDYKYKNINENPNLVKVTEDITIESDEQYYELETAWENLY